MAGYWPGSSFRCESNSPSQHIGINGRRRTYIATEEPTFWDPFVSPWRVLYLRVDQSLVIKCPFPAIFLFTVQTAQKTYPMTKFIWGLYYIRQGEEVPREDVNQDHWIGEKTVFHCGKMEIFHVVLFIVDVFQIRIIFFSSVEVEVNYGPSQYVFFGVLIFSIGITRCTFCAISKIIGKGYNILCFYRYFDVMLFFIGNSQWFCISSNFRVLWVSCFFCFYTKALVQDISTTIEGTNQAAGNFSLPTPWSVRVHSRHFPNQAFCLHSALLERCDVYTPPLHASYMNVFTPHLFTQVTWTLLHPTPPQPTPSPRMTHAWQVQENLH